jgi:pilus assembly protein CpaD
MARLNMNMTRILSLGLMAAASITLTACVKDLAEDDTYVSSTPSERFPIEYAKGPVTLAVDNTGSLEPSQVNAVAGFARQSMAGGLTPVYIRRPSGGGKKMAEDIAGLMINQGLPQHMIRIGSYPAAASAPIQISYVKGYAHTKPCGVWDENLGGDMKNENYANFGCAVQSNMAAMIADPNDLVTPDAVTPGAADIAAQNIERLMPGSTASKAAATSN